MNGFSPSTAAHGTARAGMEENWEAFGSGCLPSNSPNFPFFTTTAHGGATEDGSLTTAREKSAPSFPSESDVFSKSAAKHADEPPQKMVKCLSCSSQPPGGPRPIILIHTPRELLAYRNARPPVYIHRSSGGDTSLAIHRGDTSSVVVHDGDTSASVALHHGALLNYRRRKAHSSTCSPRSPPSPPCAACRGQKITCSHYEKAHTTPEGQCPNDRQTQQGISSGPNPESSTSPKVCASCTHLHHHHPCTSNFQDVCQSTEHQVCGSWTCSFLRRRRISLVPTLGGLHEGHVHLMRQAASLGDEVWVTIFLNPLQFQSGEDFFSYPASIDEDIRTIQQVGSVSVVFVPQGDALFPLDGLPTFSTSPAVTPSSAGASDPAASVPCRQGENVTGNCQLSQAAAVTTGTTRSAEGSSVHEKKKSCPSYQQERSNSSESNRLFRMRVFFKDIEDVDGEGKRRPGFFGGVGTVVAQLLTLTRPTYLHMGLKDFQQVVCVKRLICGLGLDVLLTAHSTVREVSGLSLSSRNKRLSEAERTSAAKYYTVLQQLRQSYDGGERRVQQLESEVRSHAAAAGLHLYYVTFDRWQDAAPVTYRRGSSFTGNTLLCSSNAAASDEADVAAGAVSSDSGASMQRMQQHMQQQVSQADGKKDVSIQTSVVQPAKETGQDKVDMRDHGQQEGPGDVEQWILESPGKYCCTIAVRGNADTTLVDNVTLTDQPHFGDLLPPPLNVPWDSGSAASKHSFFGSFLLLTSLGMHLRYLDKHDLDVLLQAEEENLKPRQDAPQLLFPPSFAALEGTEEACPTNDNSRYPVGQPPRGAAATAAADMAVQQEQCVDACERTRERRGEQTQVLRWLQERRSRAFEVEGDDGKKTLWMAKEGDKAANAQGGSKACRVRAVGLFKYNLKDDCSRGKRNVARVGRNGSRSADVVAEGVRPALLKETCAPTGNTAMTTFNDSNVNEGSTTVDIEGLTVARGESCGKDTSASYNDKGTVIERIVEGAEHRKRERFIGYVWAEEVEVEGEERIRQEGDRKDERSVGGGTHKLLRVERVFLKRQRRRQTLGTHLLRSFLAATYKQLLQEKQQQQRPAAVPPPRHEQQQEGKALQAQGQETVLLGAEKGGQHTGGVEERSLQRCRSREDTVWKIRRIEGKQVIEERTITEHTERGQNREKGEVKVSGMEESRVEDETEVNKDRKRRGETNEEIACTVQLEDVPHYFVDLLREGGFSVVRAAAETTRESAQYGSYCSMKVSLAQWYKTFVLDAIV